MSDNLPSKRRNPTYRKHKQSGQAVVTLPDGMGGRKDVLLGKYGTSASKKEYERQLATWIGNGRRLPTRAGDTPCVNEVLLAYLKHCDGYYRDAAGNPSGELANIKKAIRPAKALYGQLPAVDFDALALKAVRQKMIEAGLGRKRINLDTSRVRRCFRWAAAEKIIPASVFHELTTVEGLKAGRSAARETPPVLPVPVPHVEAVLHFLPPVVADMVQLQLATGMRSGEMVIMRAADIDMMGKIWFYRPSTHKNLYRGHTRIIAIGPRGQEIVRHYLQPRIEAFLFSPQATMRLAREDARRNRKTKRFPCEDRRRTPSRKGPGPGERYTPSSYAAAIQEGCKKADAAAPKPVTSLPSGAGS